MKKRRKLVQINTVCNNSTGHIMHDIQKYASTTDWDTLSLVGRRKVYEDLPCEKFGNSLSFWIHVGITTLFDRHGHGSLFQTKRLVARLREEKPDVIHLHNLHGYYLHIPTLFKYLKEEYPGKVFWTFHDLWPITGHCPHFVIAECEKWKTQCERCPNKGYYPISWGLDQSKKNFYEKKKLFTQLKHLEIIVPSKWMRSQVENSFLKNVPIHVVPNGINLDVFRYMQDDGIYEKYSIPRKKDIILGVASVWEERKGLNDFLQLADVLPENYVIVLVGVRAAQMKKFPNNVIGVQRTSDKGELAAMYSMAAMFLNPSKEESFSLVTIEAMACGTPVIALDTSAVKELVNENNGVVLHETKPQDYLQAIEYLKRAELNRDSVRSTVLRFSEESMAKNIVKLY